MNAAPSSAIRVARDGAVLALGLHRPEKRNALTQEMYAALHAAFAEGERDAAVRVILFHGGEDAFTAGNDLAEFLERPPADDDAPVFRFLHAVSTAAKPLVAAVNGPAVGIGTTLLLHCELVFAGDNARFQTPFAALGLVPEFAASYLAPLVAGYRRAAEWLLLGEPFDAQAAREAGLVTRILPPQRTLEAARDAARRLAALPPSSVQATKALLKAPHRAAIAAQLAAESAAFRTMLGAPAAREALAAFLARRAPDFSSPAM